MPRSVVRVRRAGVVAALLALLGGAVAPAVVAPAAASTTPVRLCTATPFRSSSYDGVWYRIPAVVRTTHGTLLAFAERRDSMAPSSDTGPTSIVVARSTDAGCSWSAPRIIARNGTDTVGNPSPVVDTATGAVLLLSVDRPQGGTSLHGLHVQRSTDDGLTFTPYSAARMDLYGQPGWSGGLTGPGHAIQLHAAASPHRGRIVVPIGYQRDGYRGAYAILSDDHGLSWRIGFNARATDTTDHRQEGTIAELPDGRLWISFHDQRADLPAGTGRIEAISSDGGRTLSTAFHRSSLPVVSVFGSALVPTGTHSDELLFSSPVRKDPTVRRDLGVYVTSSAKPGATWPHHVTVELEDTPASYSDLVQLDDATVGVLYETGRRSWHEGIGFRSIRITTLTDGVRVPSTVALAVPTGVAAGGTAHVTATVRATGTTAPAGSVRVRLTKTTGWTTSVSLDLPITAGGRRVATFPSLTRGTYRVTATYSGTSRILGKWVRGADLHVG